MIVSDSEMTFSKCCFNPFYRFFIIDKYFFSHGYHTTDTGCTYQLSNQYDIAVCIYRIYGLFHMNPVRRCFFYQDTVFLFFYTVQCVIRLGMLVIRSKRYIIVSPVILLV